MSCEVCGDLLADYKDAVALFKKAVHNNEGVLKEESVVVAGRAARWGQICKEARNALMAHWDQQHGSRVARVGSS